MLCSFSFLINLFNQAGWLLSLMWHVPPNLMFGCRFVYLLTSSCFFFVLVTLIYYFRSLKGHFEKKFQLGALNEEFDGENFGV